MIAVEIRRAWRGKRPVETPESNDRLEYGIMGGMRSERISYAFRCCCNIAEKESFESLKA